MKNKHLDCQQIDCAADPSNLDVSVLVPEEWLYSDRAKELSTRSNYKSLDTTEFGHLQIDNYRCPFKPFDLSSEKIIDIAEVDKIIGTWQKEQYENLGIKRIRLTSDGVTFELNEPKTQRISWASTLSFGETFSFKFQGNEKCWTLYDISGLKLNDSSVTKMDADSEKLTFWMGGESSEFGSTHAQYIKDLLDPLMKADLRK